MAARAPRKVAVTVAWGASGAAASEGKTLGGGRLVAPLPLVAGNRGPQDAPGVVPIPCRLVHGIH